MKTPNTLLLIVFWMLLITCQYGYANFERAMAIYTKGDFEEAKEAFEALAAIGDRSSLFNLGVMYYRGESMEREPVKGYVLMEIANKGINDKGMEAIIQKILASFTDTQKSEIVAFRKLLLPVYDMDVIEKTIFPELLDDEDCIPEITPIKKTEAVYPRIELKKGKMGITETEYVISPEGYTRDIWVEKTTSSIFAQTSADVLLTHHYAPLQDKKPIFGLRKIFTYQIETTRSVNKRSISRSLKKQKYLAESGDIIAQYRYATLLNTYKRFSTYLKGIDLQYREANKWYQKSAENGLVHSQFEMGRNMIKGRGCKVDEINGQKWINAAALGGYSPAQKMLAQSLTSDTEYSEHRSRAAIGWLKNAAQSDHFPAKILLAWELSTSPITTLRNAQEALELIEDPSDSYFDDVRILETKAAAYAQLGDFKQAKKFQQQALAAAKKLEWNIPVMQERLDVYAHKQSWEGSYY